MHFITRPTEKSTKKKNITKSGQAAENKRKWKYEECMSFVIPFFKERETQSNIAEPDSLSDGSNDEQEDISEQSAVTTGDTSEKFGVKPIKISKQITYSTKNSARYSPKKRKLKKTESASSVLMKFLV